MSPKQEDFRRRFIDNGGKFALCRTVKSVRDALVEWGIKPEGYMIIEPLPSLEEQNRAHFEAQCPPQVDFKTIRKLGKLPKTIIK